MIRVANMALYVVNIRISNNIAFSKNSHTKTYDNYKNQILI